MNFKGHRYPKEVILQTVRWYLAYSLSTRNLEEMLQERGITVDHSTINAWVLKFSPILAEAFQGRKRKPGSRLRFDETYVSIKGQWYYLYRAVDKYGETVDFLLTKKRDKKAVVRFMKKLVKRNGKPSLINIDKSGSNLSGIQSYNKEHNTRIKIRQCKYLNNIVESDHRHVKRKVRQMMGFKSFHSATKTIAGIETWQMIRKGQQKWIGDTSPVDQFYQLLA